jgi:hypothetical protein
MGVPVTERDPYAVLGVPVHAEAEAIAAAYRDKARRHHPDVSDSPDAERQMAEINAAWATLRDPERRAAWDRANLRVQPAPRSPRGGPYDPYAQPRPRGPVPPPSAGPAPRRPAAAAAHPPGAAGTTPAWRRGPHGEGAAGPPPGPRRGTVLPFGRHIGWSLGEIARVDPGYLVWLKDRREGAPYRAEIERLLAAMRQAQGPAGGQAQPPRSPKRRGLFG